MRKPIEQQRHTRLVFELRFEIEQIESEVDSPNEVERHQQVELVSMMNLERYPFQGHRVEDLLKEAAKPSVAALEGFLSRPTIVELLIEKKHEKGR